MLTCHANKSKHFLKHSFCETVVKGHMPCPEVFSIVSPHTSVKQLNAHQIRQGCVEGVLVVMIIPSLLSDPVVQEDVH